MESVACIIVAYHPNREIFCKLLKAIESQVSSVIIIDNSDDQFVDEVIKQHLPQNGSFISKGFNSGIAEALNTGILEAKNLGTSHVILFDQDSIPESNMVSKLLSVMNQKALAGYNIAAVGPKYLDIKGQHASPFVKLKGIRLRRVECAENATVLVDHLISSGCLISMKALDEVGLMEEKLFIDYVDTEWCLRAIHKGYSLLGVGSAEMQHDLGDQFTHICGRTIPVHSSLRYYYLIRNGLWLSRQSWVSKPWKLMDLRRLFLIYVVYSFFIGTKFQNWKMMTKGIWHAMTGKMGKYSG